jgi:hypothetical protein
MFPKSQQIPPTRDPHERSHRSATAVIRGPHRLVGRLPTKSQPPPGARLQLRPPPPSRCLLLLLLRNRAIETAPFHDDHRLPPPTAAAAAAAAASRPWRTREMIPRARGLDEEGEEGEGRPRRAWGRRSRAAGWRRREIKGRRRRQRHLLLHHAAGRACTSKRLLIKPTGSCRLYRRGCR